MRRRWGCASEAAYDARGSATVELMLSISLLILILWFVILCGRMSDARLRIEDVAHQAARAATIEGNEAVAAAQARNTANAALGEAGVTCRSLDVTTMGSVRPGSTVTVTISCAVGLHDLALLGVPGTATLTARFASPVDVYRGGTAHNHRTTLERIVELYTGDLFDGHTAEWLEAPREAVRRDVLDAVSTLVHILRDTEPEQALALLERARRFDRYNEAIYRDIARFQSHLGQHDAVSRTLALLTTTLTELDDEPSSETVALFTSLRSPKARQPAT
ncbi:bacterial transcriptional activator domain-containing protein [Streptomyces sp. NPDC059479]|uniref:bacterial transcriptional activator domain-containing protein n=1 Tax=Streptomyces sp. NPDC059479 TaxID=3346848 RepID=UPI003679C147